MEEEATFIVLPAKSNRPLPFKHTYSIISCRGSPTYQLKGEISYVLTFRKAFALRAATPQQEHVARPISCAARNDNLASGVQLPADLFLDKSACRRNRLHCHGRCAFHALARIAPKPAGQQDRSTAVESRNMVSLTATERRSGQPWASQLLIPNRFYRRQIRSFFRRKHSEDNSYNGRYAKCQKHCQSIDVGWKN